MLGGFMHRTQYRNRLLSCWPRDFDSLRVLDWIDGDGTTPTVGPTLTLTGTATTRGATMPLRHRCSTKGEGGVVGATAFATGSHYKYTAAAVDPGTKDHVVLVLVRPTEALPSAAVIYCGTRTVTTTTVGWRIGQTATPGQAIFSCHDGSTHVYGAVAAALVQNKVTLLIGVHDYDGNTTLYTAGAAAAASNASTTVIGAVDSTLGIGINGAPAGTGDYGNDIHRVQVLYGTNLADSWTAAYVASVQAKILGDGRTWVIGS